MSLQRAQLRVELFLQLGNNRIVHLLSPQFHPFLKNNTFFHNYFLSRNKIWKYGHIIFTL
ncbi:Uncharacterised protein [Vibrio cholerae]|nr:Uncharacterised protein [Vibrio cholerae]CSB63330.1 Uncharacterised protein [Vibrio cholerae]